MQIFFFGCVELIGYFASDVNVVSPNPCADASPKIKISITLYNRWDYINSKNNYAFFPYFHL